MVEWDVWGMEIGDEEKMEKSEEDSHDSVPPATYTR